MAELQTSYSNTIAKGFAGMVADGETSNRITRTCEDAAGIAFGAPVYRGAGDHGCTGTVGTAGDLPRLRDREAPASRWCRADADEYQQYDNVGILTSGAIYVPVKGAVNDGDALTVGKGGGPRRSHRRHRGRRNSHRDGLRRRRNGHGRPLPCREALRGPK
jgi:hypothetical protein